MYDCSILHTLGVDVELPSGIVGSVFVCSADVPSIGVGAEDFGPFIVPDVRRIDCPSLFALCGWEFFVIHCISVFLQEALEVAAVSCVIDFQGEVVIDEYHISQEVIRCPEVLQFYKKYSF